MRQVVRQVEGGQRTPGREVARARGQLSGHRVKTHGQRGALRPGGDYTVRPGDTLWGIAEEFCAKNTATCRYILEYKEGMYENNPWLVERKGMIYPGDQLTLTYWVKGDKEEAK